MDGTRGAKAFDKAYEAPTIKQHLAAIRMLCGFLVERQVLPINPARDVRGPKHVVTKGKTPHLTAEDARTLFESIDPGTVVGLRDRALLGLMVYSFARIGAALSMDVEDYYQAGRRMMFRLREKGGKMHEMPAHHTAIEYMDTYLARLGEHRPWPRRGGKASLRPVPGTALAAPPKNNPRFVITTGLGGVDSAPRGEEARRRK